MSLMMIDIDDWQTARQPHGIFRGYIPPDGCRFSGALKGRVESFDREDPRFQTGASHASDPFLLAERSQFAVDADGDGCVLVRTADAHDDGGGLGRVVGPPDYVIDNRHR